ncbi:glycosyltransferase family 2 protein [Ferrovibrio sp.]|uniref:glycosyltransferase family 2 protein n=1 Tax=Ferrovibrio sp. TaxID=1917215 RepID=UPI003D0C9AE8
MTQKHSKFKFPRVSRYDLLPRNQLEMAGHRYRSLGNDPYFFLSNQDRQPFPSGWVLFSYTGHSQASPLRPRLYVDYGTGFSEHTAVALPPCFNRRVTIPIFFPTRPSALRFDPIDHEMTFEIEDVTAVEIGKVWLGFNRLALLLQQLPMSQWYGALRRALTHKEGKRVGLRELLISNHGPGGNPLLGYDEWVGFFDTLTAADMTGFTRLVEALPKPPVISVVMPVYNTPKELLCAAVDSVRRQIYPHWELCIADDASTATWVKPMLQQYAAEDSRIKVAFRDQNGHISAASNSALALASGDYIALLDHDDELREHALAMVALAIDAHPQADILYSDEDKIDTAGRRFDPCFKPEWNPDLFYSQNMINHLGVYRHELVRKAGGFRIGFEGSQDYDLALRVLEQTSPDRIIHIPFILYHWRAVAGSLALNADQKSYPHERARLALQEHFDRKELKARSVPGKETYHRTVWALPEQPPLVSIIVPTRNKWEVLKGCVDGVRENNDYQNWELIIVDNGSDDAASLDYLASLSADKRIRVIRSDMPFNFSALNNLAAAASDGDILAFLNNDLAMIEPHWLTEMVSHALRPDIGAVGAKLLFSNNSVQHGGVILGIGGVAGHLHKYRPATDPGYFGRAVVTQNLSAVTAACLVMRRRVFEQVGGFNAVDLAVAFNDVDLCLKVREAGYRIIWTPFAELYHLESISRGAEDTPEKARRFKAEVDHMMQAWGNVLRVDPAYNPNLTLNDETLSLAFPPRVSWPTRQQPAPSDMP